MDRLARLAPEQLGGSLYILALTGTRWWGAVTPLGGVAFLAGWLCLVLSVRAR